MLILRPGSRFAQPHRIVRRAAAGDIVRIAFARLDENMVFDSGTAIVSTSISVKANSVLFVLASCSYFQAVAGDASFFRIVVDSDIQPLRLDVQNSSAGSGANSYHSMMLVALTDSLSAGAHTVSLRWHPGTGDGPGQCNPATSPDFYHATLFVAEIRFGDEIVAGALSRRTTDFSTTSDSFSDVVSASTAVADNSRLLGFGVAAGDTVASGTYGPRCRLRFNGATVAGAHLDTIGSSSNDVAGGFNWITDQLAAGSYTTAIQFADVSLGSTTRCEASSQPANHCAGFVLLEIGEDVPVTRETFS
jgi:hypothetical protein